MAKTTPFDNHLDEYEKWFVDNHNTFLSELEAIRELLPVEGKGVEIGVGSGLFASALCIDEGCDPSENMLKKAESRGIKAIYGIAEDLPYEDKSFDFALLVTTICFVDDPEKCIREINRILKPRGELIIGFVDSDSQLGKQYLQEKDRSIFYKDASFFSTEDIHELLQANDFIIGKTVQTVFGSLNEIKNIQRPQNGHGKGSFIVTRAIKKVKQPLSFAMAVDESDNFDVKQFCYACKFLVYEWENNQFTFKKEVTNPYRYRKQGDEPDQEEKGERIIRLLQENKVTALVSRNFGNNIEKAAASFIPVKVLSVTPGEVKKVLIKHMSWLSDEIQNKAGGFNLFTIRHGILKTRIHKKAGEINKD